MHCFVSGIAKSHLEKAPVLKMVTKGDELVSLVQQKQRHLWHVPGDARSTLFQGIFHHALILTFGLRVILEHFHAIKLIRESARSLLNRDMTQIL